MTRKEKNKEEIEKNLRIASDKLEKIDLKKFTAERAPQTEKIAPSEKKIEKIDKEKANLDSEILETEDHGGNEMVIDPGVQMQKRKIKEIETILEEDLEEIYSNMPVNKQKEFKIEGERVSRKISELISASKIKIKKIITLIRGWLSIIPGVNKFFLEQEIKIKTDKIIKLRGK